MGVSVCSDGHISMSYIPDQTLAMSVHSNVAPNQPNSLSLNVLGPCPPCPKTTRVTCYCGRSQPMVKRCGVRGWSCGRVCRKVLSCELHTCEQRCHEGRCNQ